jgi:hypothetical protein
MKTKYRCSQNWIQMENREYLKSRMKMVTKSESTVWRIARQLSSTKSPNRIRTDNYPEVVNFPPTVPSDGCLYLNLCYWHYVHCKGYTELNDKCQNEYESWVWIKWSRLILWYCPFNRLVGLMKSLERSTSGYTLDVLPCPIIRIHVFSKFSYCPGIK